MGNSGCKGDCGGRKTLTRAIKVSLDVQKHNRKNIVATCWCGQRMANIFPYQKLCTVGNNFHQESQRRTQRDICWRIQNTLDEPLHCDSSILKSVYQIQLMSSRKASGAASTGPLEVDLCQQACHDSFELVSAVWPLTVAMPQPVSKWVSSDISVVSSSSAIIPKT